MRVWDRPDDDDYLERMDQLIDQQQEAGDE